MKKKIICILVMTLLIIGTTTLATSKENYSNPSVIDQQQPNHDELYWLEPAVDSWQLFKNKGNILEFVDLHVGCYFGGSPPITLFIVDAVSGVIMTQVTYQASSLPLNYQDWFTFDVSDVKLKPNNMYKIVLRGDVGSEYCWSGSHNDPYPLGGSSHPDPDWDFAFRTIVDKKPRALVTPFQKFLENHINMLAMLRLLMGL